MSEKIVRGIFLTGWLFLAAFGLPAYALNPPVISPDTGSFAQSQTVSMAAPVGNIYYTTDGATPTNASTPYTAPFAISSPTQIKAVAYQSGTYSTVTTKYLDVDPSLAPVLQTGLMLRLHSDFGVVATGVGSPAMPVSQWVDLSGSGNTASGSPESQPNLVFGQPSSIAFNGISQFLSLPSIFINAGGASIFLVVKPVAPATNARFFDIGNGAAANNVYMSEPSTNAADLHVYRDSTDSSVSSSSAITTGQFQLLEGTYNGTNTATIYTNGVQGAQSTSMQTIKGLTRSSNFIGQASGGGSYYSGSIAEILIYQGLLSSKQRTAIEAYLMQKYQLPPTNPAAPIISVPGGTLAGPTQVVISSQSGTVTYITTDGSTPTNASQVYCGRPIIINYSQTLKAISIKNGASSSVTTATYTLDSNQWPVPNPGDMSAPTINLELPAQTQ